MAWNDVGSIRGPQGEQGIQGEQGETGEQGPTGDTGATGSTGVTTLAGATDYDNSTPATNGQAITYVTSGSKFKPTTLTAASVGAASSTHNHAAGDINSGTLDAARIPAATSGATGGVRLTGDLGGTSTSPTVPGLTAKAPLASPSFTGTVEFEGPRYDNWNGLSNAATVAIDASICNLHTLTANANRTLGVPTGGVDGQAIRLRIAADGTSRTITFHGSYLLTTGVASSYVVPASKMSFVGMECTGSNVWYVTAVAVQA